MLIIMFLDSTQFSQARLGKQSLSTPSYLAAVNRLVDKKRPSFDAEASMLRIPFASPGYHTTITGGEVHPTRESLWYAAALLDTARPEDGATALAIFYKVLALQDTDPASKTYGIWPWFLEESLAQMSPPDWNWADFCGAQLLEVLLTHRSQFPAELAAQMDSAIVHAARSIERRNVGPHYTNIAIMGAFVTLAAAESYEIEDLLQYGLQRLRLFRDHTRQQGSFSEYNSPTYTIVALNELARLQQYVRSPEAQAIAAEFYRMGWEELARHFHAPTQQWAGPHSRCYHNLLPAETLELIRRATASQSASEEDFDLALGEHRILHRCPADLIHHFHDTPAPHIVRRTFIKGEPATIGTTFLTPDFALGSINHCDLWNQRRNLLAYWGTAKQPQWMHLRFLHDGYDFSSAHFFSSQSKNKVLGGIGFITDGGDKHIHLDPVRNATIQARDLRLRFEFGGSDGPPVLIAPQSINQPLSFKIGSLHFQMSVPLALWGNSIGKWETGRNEKIAWADVVLHSGEAYHFDLNALGNAALVITFQLSPKNPQFHPVTLKHTAGHCVAKWEGMSMAFDTTPRPLASHLSNFASPATLDENESVAKSELSRKEMAVGR